MTKERKLVLDDVRSLRHRAADVIRDAILSGELAPNERLVESDIASEMNISRGTVRESLRMLEQDGLVISYPHRETVVLAITPDEVKELLFPVRFAVEQYAFKKALPKLDEKDFEALQELVESMQVACEKNDVKSVVDLDMEFHQTIIRVADEHHCSQIWSSITHRIRNYLYRTTPKHEDLSHVAKEHWDLLADL